MLEAIKRRGTHGRPLTREGGDSIVQVPATESLVVAAAQLAESRRFGKAYFTTGSRELNDHANGANAKLFQVRAPRWWRRNSETIVVYAGYFNRRPGLERGSYGIRKWYESREYHKSLAANYTQELVQTRKAKSVA